LASSGIKALSSLCSLFAPLVVEEGVASFAVKGGECGPGIRRTHIHDPDRLDAGPGRLGIDEVNSDAARA
jgi:hypothetical protein